MYKNYFFLNRFILEANSVLEEYTINSIFTQEKDKLIFACRKKDAEKFIEISVEPGSPYITIKESFHRAKKNTIDFFSDYVPSKFHSIEISGKDRVLKIVLDTADIFFTIRGKYSNVAVISRDGYAEYFKNMPEDFNEDNFINEMNASAFTDQFNIPDINIAIKNDAWAEIKSAFPFIGKEILLEAKYRCQSERYEEIVKTVNDIISEIQTAIPVIFSNSGTSQLNIGFENFHTFPGKEINTFNDVITAFNFYLSKYYYTGQIETKKKIIAKHIDKELHRITGKLNSVKAAIDRGSRDAEYKKSGDLLLINIHSIRKGMDSIEVPDIYLDNNPVKIKLDETLAPRQNIDKYFENAKNDKIRLEKSKELYDISSAQFIKMKQLEEKLSLAGTIEDYNYLMKELKIKDAEAPRNEEDLSVKFKHYIIEGKYNVFVGKDSKNNDLLTLKFAKQNDYWFHARKVPGSHAVLRVENKKEAIPKNILSKAASLAAYHSKAKTSGLAPVSYAQKKYVVKKKGMEPGQVAMMKEDVLIVKPEIPKGCEYLSNE